MLFNKLTTKHKSSAFLQTIDKMININIMSVCKVSYLLPTLFLEVLTENQHTTLIQLSEAVTFTCWATSSCFILE